MERGEPHLLLASAQSNYIEWSVCERANTVTQMMMSRLALEVARATYSGKARFTWIRV